MIYELLDTGEQNARTAKSIANATNLNTRDVTQIIRLERLAGIPICSNCRGYFLPETDIELKETVVRIYKQAKETKKVADAMKKIKFKRGRNEQK